MEKPVCTPKEELKCPADSNAPCICVRVPEQQCQVTLSFPNANPQEVAITNATGCDSAGLLFAFTAIAAKLATMFGR